MERLHQSVGAFLVAIILLGHAAGASASLKTPSRANKVSSSTISHLSESGIVGSNNLEVNLAELSPEKVRVIPDDHDYEPVKCDRDCPRGKCQCYCYTTHCLCCSRACCTAGGEY